MTEEPPLEDAGGLQPAYDPKTGEEIQVNPERNPPPALRSLIAARSSMPKLDTPQAVETELQRELWKLEVVGRRLTEVQQMVHGYYTPNGYVAGAEFEYAEEYDQQIRTLYDECHDLAIPKEDRKKWPGEDVRTSIVNKNIPKEKRERRSALKGELKSLEEYRRITEARANGLQSLLAFRREEARVGSQTGGRV